MNAERFISSAQNILDAISEHRNALIWTQMQEIWRMLDSLLHEQNTSKFISRTRGLTANAPKGKPNNPTSCYNRIPDLATLVQTFHDELPSGKITCDMEISRNEIDTVKQMISNCIDALKDKQPIQENDIAEQNDRELPGEEWKARFFRDVREIQASGYTPGSRGDAIPDDQTPGALKNQQVRREKFKWGKKKRSW